MKLCFKCKIEKPLTDFYPQKSMKDGHLNKCKVCTIADVKKYRADNHARVCEYDRMRFQTTERKVKVVAYQKIRRAKFPEKYKARMAVGNAVRDGRLKKLPCDVCGDVESQAHHHDYSKPLDVRWLCFKCHREIEHGQKVEVVKLTHLRSAVA